jgi:hypothetical protein
MAAVRCGRGCRLVVPLKRAGVKLPRRCQVSVNLCDPISALTTVYAPANLGNPLSFGIWPRFGNSNARTVYCGTMMLVIHT